MTTDGPSTTRPRVVRTLTSDLCTAYVVEDDTTPGRGRFVSLLVDGGEVTERRYVDDESDAVDHARTMLFEQRARSGRAWPAARATAVQETRPRS